MVCAWERKSRRLHIFLRSTVFGSRESYAYVTFTEQSVSMRYFLQPIYVELNGTLVPCSWPLNRWTFCKCLRAREYVRLKVCPKVEPLTFRKKRQKTAALIEKRCIIYIHPRTHSQALCAFSARLVSILLCSIQVFLGSILPCLHHSHDVVIHVFTAVIDVFFSDFCSITFFHSSKKFSIATIQNNNLTHSHS